MTRSASDFHAHWLTIHLLPVARGHPILTPEQVSGTLEQSFSLVSVATETGFVDSETSQHLLGQLCVYDLCGFTLRRVREVGKHPVQQLDVVNVVARQATHITSVMLSTLPVEVAAIHRMALQARLIRCGRSQLSGIADIAFAGGLSTRLRVLLAVRVADFAFCRT